MNKYGFATIRSSIRAIILSRLISYTNRKNLGYKLTLNQFSDRTEAELAKYKGLISRPKGKTGTIPFPYSDSELDELVQSLPKEYDARLHGLVTPVKSKLKTIFDLFHSPD